MQKLKKLLKEKITPPPTKFKTTGRKVGVADNLDIPETGLVNRRKSNSGKQFAITPYDEMWESFVTYSDEKTFPVSKRWIVSVNYEVGKLLDKARKAIGINPEKKNDIKELENIRMAIADMLLDIADEAGKKNTSPNAISEEEFTKNTDGIKLMEFVPVRFKERDKVIAIVPFSTRGDSVEGVVTRVSGDKYFIVPDAQSLNKLDYSLRGRVKDGLWLSGSELKKKAGLTQQDVQKTAASLMGGDR